MYGSPSRRNSRTNHVQDLSTRAQWTSTHVHGVQRTLVAKIFVENPEILPNLDTNVSILEEMKPNKVFPLFQFLSQTRETRRACPTDPNSHPSSQQGLCLNSLVGTCDQLSPLGTDVRVIQNQVHEQCCWYAAMYGSASRLNSRTNHVQDLSCLLYTSPSPRD